MKVYQTTESWKEETEIAETQVWTFSTTYKYK